MPPVACIALGVPHTLIAACSRVNPSSNFMKQSRAILRASCGGSGWGTLPREGGDRGFAQGEPPQAGVGPSRKSIGNMKQVLMFTMPIDEL